MISLANSVSRLIFPSCRFFLIPFLCHFRIFGEDLTRMQYFTFKFRRGTSLFQQVNPPGWEWKKKKIKKMLISAWS